MLSALSFLRAQRLPPKGLLGLVISLVWLTGCGGDSSPPPTADGPVTIRLGDLVDRARLDSAVDLTDLQSLLDDGARVLLDRSFAASARAVPDARVRRGFLDPTLTGDAAEATLPVHVLAVRLPPGQAQVWAVARPGRALADHEALFLVPHAEVPAEDALDDDWVQRRLLSRVGQRERMRPLPEGVGLGQVVEPDREERAVLLCAVVEPETLAALEVRVQLLTPRAGWHLRQGEALDSAPWHRTLRSGPAGSRTEVLLFGAPGSFELDVTLPDQAPVLETAATVLLGRRQTQYTAVLRATSGDGTLETSAEVGGPSVGWTDLALDLAPFAGRDTTLRLEVDGGDAEPGALIAFRSPVVTAASDSLPPDVFLISLDTTRADRTSLHGNPRRTTPTLEALAQRAAVFDAAIAPATWTLPSHVSILSGQLPDRHGVFNDMGHIAPGTPWLADDFRRAGYRTVAFTGSGYVDPQFGFAEQFDDYGIVDPACPPLAWAEAHPEGLRGRALEEATAAEESRQRLLALLAAPRRRPLFLFAHTYQSHEYHPLPEALDEFVAQAPDDAPFEDRALLLDGVYGGTPKTNPFVQPLRDAAETARLREQALLIYDGALRASDDFVRDLLAAQEAAGRLDDTIVVITSDHGESLYEHDVLGHGKTLLEAEIHVPLLVLGPGVTPRRIADVVSLADLAPTLRELCALEPHDEGQTWTDLQDGRSLVPLLDGGSLPRRPALARTGGRSPGQPVLRVLRDERIKYQVVDHPDGTRTASLYDLASDPGEHRDLLAERPRESAALAERLDGLVRGLQALGPEGVSAELSPDLLQELQALGYFGGR